VKKKPSSRTKKPAKSTAVFISRHRSIILVDEAPIRGAALAKYHKIEKEIARARDQIEAFEAGDLPAYGHWEARAFGPLLTELRSIEMAIEEKERLLEAIDDEIFWTGCSPVTAYRRVMGRKDSPEGGENGNEDEPEDDDFNEFDEDDTADGPRLFGDSDLPPGFDVDEFDRMPQRAKKDFRAYYQEMAMLFEMFTGLRAPPVDEVLQAARDKKHGRAETGGTSRHDGPNHHGPTAHSRAQVEEEDPAKRRETDRLKDLYRSLVRQLHPDANPNQTARERELWHQVQHAYQKRDLELLESVAGRLEIGLNGRSATLPIQFLLRMTFELESALKGLRSRVNSLRRHPGWEFRKNTKGLAKFEAKRRRQIEDDTMLARAKLAHLTLEIEDLAEKANQPRKPRGSKKPAKKSQKSRMREETPTADWTQGELF